MLAKYLLLLQVDELETSREVEDEDDDDDDDDTGDFEGLPEDTDEEYVPAAESGSASSPVANKHGAESKAEGAENSEDAGDDGKRDSVQCPVCDKTFKSKYYLKVHKR